MPNHEGSMITSPGFHGLWTEAQAAAQVEQPPPKRVQYVQDKFVESDIAEVARIRRLLDTGEYDSPDFIAHLVPSALFSVFHLAPKYDILLSGEQVELHSDHIYRAVVTCRRGVQSRSGAAQSKYEETAKWLAWRNAIRALMLTEELVREQLKSRRKQS